LNLTTHRITAQYHCVFDDWFATVDMNPDEIPDFESDTWTYLFGNARYLHAFDPDDGPPPMLHPDFHQDVTEPVHHPQEEPNPETPLTRSAATNQREDHLTQPNITDDNVDPLLQSKTEIVDQLPQPKTETNTQVPQTNNPNGSFTPIDALPEALPETDALPPTIPETAEPDRETEGDQAPTLEQPILRRTQRVNKGKFISRRFREEEFSLLMFDQDPSAPALDFIYSAYNAAINDPDTLSWSEAMRAADACCGNLGSCG
jgi:hypothetical protein